jgi:hypothetical protein
MMTSTYYLVLRLQSLPKIQVQKFELIFNILGNKTTTESTNFQSLDTFQQVDLYRC